MLRIVYTLLWLLILPLALLRLTWRSRKEPGYLHHVGERLGRYDDLPSDGPWLWVHAVSVGETRAAQPLIDALLAAYPQHRLLLTHMTPTGRQTGAQLYGSNPRVQQCYLPYDVPFPARRRFDHGNGGLAEPGARDPACRRAAVPGQRPAVAAQLSAHGAIRQRGRLPI
jgi:3-deoxy-D-manno-octulosonic-acid transferase